MPLNVVPSLHVAVIVFVSCAWLAAIGTARPKMRIAESRRFRIAGSSQVATTSLTPLGSGDHEINLPAPTAGAGKAGMPVDDGRLGAVALDHFARVGSTWRPQPRHHTTNRTPAGAALPRVIGGPR